MNRRATEVAPKPPLTAEAAAAATPESVLQMFASSMHGLPAREAGMRLARLGPNALVVESRSLRTIALEQLPTESTSCWRGRAC